MGHSLEELKKELHDAITALKEKADSSSEKQEVLEKAIQEIQSKLEKLEAERKTLPQSDTKIVHPNILKRKAIDEFEDRIQEINDNLVLCSQILNVNPNETKLYQYYKDFYPEEMKALYEAAGHGGDFVPVGYSPRMFEEIKAALKVAAIHEIIPMPDSVYKFPITYADAKAYLVPESQSDTGQASDKIPATSPSTGAFTLSAKKLATRVRFSEELNEDSIVPIINVVRKKIVEAVASAIEDAIINGDTAANHMDANVTSSNDARKAWNGYRKLCLSACKVDGGGNALTWGEVVEARAKMKKYGLNPDDLVYVTSITCYLKNLIDLKDASGNRVVTTVDKYGSSATILNGELGKLAGSPIIVSEYVREDLNESGVYDDSSGANQDRTLLIIVHKGMFYLGNRRELTIKTGADIETDQQIVVATTRMAFGSPFEDKEVLALVYNIKP